tara:strand:+ start:28 stop:1854 length:1827 start_codon:yes stop_codon:yes gene_type:complete
MRILFFTLIISQFLILFKAFAEQYRDESDNSGRIKWEKIDGNTETGNEQIIWKSYNNDESYFEREKDIKVKSKKFKTEDIKFLDSDLDLENYKLITQIAPFFPLNNFMDYGDFRSSIEWKSSFDGGNGISSSGQQNNSLKLDYGISENTQFTFYFSEADNYTYNEIKGKKTEYAWQNYAFSIKRKLYNFEDKDIDFSLLSSIEFWRSSSGSSSTKSIFNEKDDSLGQERFNKLIGSFAIPVTKKVNKKLTLAIVPGISFLPEKMGDRTDRDNFYGNNFYIGAGFTLNLYQDLVLMASYTNPLGPGNNYFDSNLNFSRKAIYSFGITWNVNQKIALTGKITNSFGSTPATGMLTIPSDNLNLYSLNINYRPVANDTIISPLNKRDELIAVGGLTVNNALIPEEGTTQNSFNFDSNGNLFGFYGYSLSDIFQLEIINVGAFKNHNNSNQNLDLQNTYLNKNNFNLRLGGKLLILSPQKDDSFWMSLRTSVGRSQDTNEGYVYSELPTTFRLNNFIALNISPKYFFSGEDSFGALGLSGYFNISEKIIIIPEINSQLKSNQAFNYTVSLRYSFLPMKSIDLYYSNAAGLHDIGQNFNETNSKFGIKLNFLF